MQDLALPLLAPLAMRVRLAVGVPENHPDLCTFSLTAGQSTPSHRRGTQMWNWTGPGTRGGRSKGGEEGDGEEEGEIDTLEV